LLTGLAVAPVLTLVAEYAEAQTGGIDAIVAETHAALKDAKGTKLVILGTSAGPNPGIARHMTSHVLLSNGAAYVLDCGLGVTRQFARSGIPWRALRAILITHHHPDHNRPCAPMGRRR
jgi:glyoxylase-like metal-dependent hydrolase (beta-lactamase superfamily II)